jgi:hypothetical protein
MLLVIAVAAFTVLVAVIEWLGAIGARADRHR